MPQVYVRRPPDRRAPVLRVMTEFRRDYRPQVVLVLDERVAPGGSRWYRLSLPGRPNGQRGWVPADAVRVRSVANRIVVRRGARLLEVRRLADGKVVFRAPVAVGMPGAPTPLGRNFYVQSRWAPTDSFYGPFALETSAYSQPQRLAGRRRRRHPRHEPARADRPGRLARLHPDAERGRRAPAPPAPRRDADRRPPLTTV